MTEFEHLNKGVCLTYTSYALLSSGVPWNVSRVTCIFSLKARAFSLVCIPTNYKWQLKFSIVYHERALHNYFIPCCRKYSGQRNQCDIRAAHDWKVGCYTDKYTTVFLHSDRLYFIWHGIKVIIFFHIIDARETGFKLTTTLVFCWKRACGRG